MALHFLKCVCVCFCFLENYFRNVRMALFVSDNIKYPVPRICIRLYFGPPQLNGRRVRMLEPGACVDFFWEGRSGGGGGNESALYEGEGPLQLGAAEAQALVGGGGHSKRPNPLLLGRGQRPKSTRRGGKGGGGGGGGGWWKPKGKGKGSVSSIFQMSITALSFLAFGGYLVCMIVNAVRSNGGVMAMAGMTASNAAAPSPASLVLGGKRPYSYGRRRKRRNHLQEEETSTREATAQIPAFTERSDSVVDDVTEPMHRDDDVNEEAEWGHVPPGRFDDMYRALLMISEGYSLYHSHHHGGIA